MKDDISFINKTIEFYCNREITETEFKDFIYKIRRLGFVSKKKHPKIQFITMDGDIIYNYNYNTGIAYPKKSIKSIHYHQNLFIRHLITPIENINKTILL